MLGEDVVSAVAGVQRSDFNGARLLQSVKAVLGRGAFRQALVNPWVAGAANASHEARGSARRESRSEMALRQHLGCPLGIQNGDASRLREETHVVLRLVEDRLQSRIGRCGHSGGALHRLVRGNGVISIGVSEMDLNGLHVRLLLQSHIEQRENSATIQQRAASLDAVDVSGPDGVVSRKRVRVIVL